MKQELLKFVLVGIVCTIVNYCLFFVLLSYLNWHYLVASAVGFFSGVCVGYLLNKLWTFQVTHSSNSLFIKYISVYVFSLVLSLLFLNVCVEWLNIDAKIANVLAIGLTTCTNFIGIKFWAFSHKGNTP